MVDVEGEPSGGAVRFGWAVAAAARGKGAKKRKLLVETMVSAWRRADEGGVEFPTVEARTVYKLMAGTLNARAVMEELKGLCSMAIQYDAG